METKHILLTTDLSEEAQRAFQPVRNLALWVGSRITLLHVIQVVTKVPTGAMLATPITLGDPEKEAAQARKKLEEQRELLGSDVDVECVVITGENVAREIVHYSRDHDVGLIAISTHGRSGLRRVLLGSVAEAVLRHSHVPVLCFPPPGNRDEHAG